jgi:hypothetical protein
MEDVEQMLQPDIADKPQTQVKRMLYALPSRQEEKINATSSLLIYLFEFSD